jgi:hypothetical protein
MGAPHTAPIRMLIILNHQNRQKRHSAPQKNTRTHFGASVLLAAVGVGRSGCPRSVIASVDTQTHKCIYICISVYISVYMYICMHVYICICRSAPCEQTRTTITLTVIISFDTSFLKVHSTLLPEGPSSFSASSARLLPYTDSPAQVLCSEHFQSHGSQVSINALSRPFFSSASA